MMVKTSKSVAEMAGFRGIPLSSGKEFSWQRPKKESERPAIDRSRVQELERKAIIATGGKPSAGGRTVYPPSGLQRATLDRARLWVPDGNHGNLSNKETQAVPHLDSHFVYYSVMKDFPDLVLDDDTIRTRFQKGPQALAEEIEKALISRANHMDSAQRLQESLQSAREENQSKAAVRLERRIRHRKMMVEATNEELRVAFFFGPSSDSFDRHNPSGMRRKFRTDIETADFMTEVTIGKSKKLAQLDDYVYANNKERYLIMYAPNMEQKWAKNAVLKRGFEIVRNVDELFEMVNKLIEK